LERDLDEPDLEREELAREGRVDEPDLARLDEPERDALVRDEPERLDELDRERVDAEPDRELAAREPELREPELRDPLDERLEPFDELRVLLDRDVPLRRSAAGISSLATAFASFGICFSRNFAIRSSSRRMPRASLAVSLSFTASASASMPV
jgi:hypothetical protein